MFRSAHVIATLDHGESWPRLSTFIHIPRLSLHVDKWIEMPILHRLKKVYTMVSSAKNCNAESIEHASRSPPNL
jgi:hypothetical protein